MSRQQPDPNPKQAMRGALSTDPDLARRREEAQSALGALLRLQKKAPYTVLRVYDPYNHTPAQVFKTPAGLIYYGRMADVSVTLLDSEVGLERGLYRMRQTRSQPFVDFLTTPSSLTGVVDRVPADCDECRVQLSDPHLRIDLLLAHAATALEQMPQRRKVYAVDVRTLGADA